MCDRETLEGRREGARSWEGTSLVLSSQPYQDQPFGIWLTLSTILSLPRVLQSARFINICGMEALYHKDKTKHCIID